MIQILNIKRVVSNPYPSLWRMLLSTVIIFYTFQLQAQNVIGGSVADSSAILDLQSSNRGLLIPRMTIDQRTAIVNPAVGLMIYNTSLGCVEVNAGTENIPDWTCLFVLAGQVGSIDCDQAVGATSFFVGRSVSNFRLIIPYTSSGEGFYSSQAVASTGVAGLTATIEAGAFRQGTGSIVCTISGTPAEVGSASFALSIGGEDCSLSLPVIAGCGAYVASGVWKELMCHNLGANTLANPFVPSWELIGNYYQWGRNPSCFGRDGIDAANSCDGPVYGAAGPWGNTVASDNEGSISGWNTVPSPNGAWQDGAKTSNDPCPAGFRVPTLAQWIGINNRSLNSLAFVGAWTNFSTNYGSGIKFGNSLFLPAAGIRSSFDGVLFSRDNSGYYWSSSVGTSLNAWYLDFTRQYVGLNTSNERLIGGSVRCIEEPPPGTIASLNCASAINSGRPVIGVATSGVSSTISYTGSNGGSYSGQSVGSTGVTGLTATLDAGTFALGSGSLTYTITGLPSAVGTASFALNINGSSCTLNLPVLAAATISSLNCASATNIGILTAGIAGSMSSNITYTGGNGGTYNGQMISSTGVTGLTATLLPGAFANGSGSLVYTITGVPSGQGTASFAINIGGRSCTLNVTVRATSVGDCGAFVAAGVWKQFLCHNLGANTGADPLNPSWELIGNYYQWGRNPSCFGIDIFDGTNPCGSPVYGAAGPWGSTTANDNADGITGWSITNAPNGAWQDGVKTANDPCPAGFRVPTKTQWDGVSNSSLNARTFIGTWSSSSTNYSSGIRFGSSLLLPAAGYRNYSLGTLSSRGSLGYYWSSTEFSSGSAWDLFFGSGYANTDSYYRTYGFSVRCIAE